MLLICPHCDTRYRVEPTDWGGTAQGTRKVRCRNCGTVWTATIPAVSESDAASDAASDTVDEPEDPMADATEDARPGHPFLRRLFFIGTPVALLLVAGTAYLTVTGAGDRMAGRVADSIAAARQVLPQTISAPDLSWLRLPARPATMLEASARHEVETLPDGRPAWRITATLRNPARSLEAVPPVTFEITDRTGRVLTRWTVRAPATSIAPDRALTFETVRVAPPADGADVRAILEPAALARP